MLGCVVQVGCWSSSRFSVVSITRLPILYIYLLCLSMSYRHDLDAVGRELRLESCPSLIATKRHDVPEYIKIVITNRIGPVSQLFRPPVHQHKSTIQAGGASRSLATRTIITHHSRTELGDAGSRRISLSCISSMKTYPLPSVSRCREPAAGNVTLFGKVMLCSS